MINAHLVLVSLSLYTVGVSNDNTYREHARNMHQSQAKGEDFNATGSISWAWHHGNSDGPQYQQSRFSAHRLQSDPCKGRGTGDFWDTSGRDPTRGNQAGRCDHQHGREQSSLTADLAR